MEPDQLKKTVEDLTEETRKRIEAKPIPAFFIGVIIGYIIGRYPNFFIPVLSLVIVAGVVLYFWNSSNKEEAASKKSSKKSKSDSKE